MFINLPPSLTSLRPPSFTSLRTCMQPVITFINEYRICKATHAASYQPSIRLCMQGHSGHQKQRHQNTKNMRSSDGNVTRITYVTKHPAPKKLGNAYESPTMILLVRTHCFDACAALALVQLVQQYCLYSAVHQASSRAVCAHAQIVAVSTRG